MQILELSPIHSMHVKMPGSFRLAAKYSMWDNLECGIHSFADIGFKNFSKFGVFLYDKKNIPNILTMDVNKSNIVFFELTGVMTTTDVSMTDQSVIFDITFFPKDTSIGCLKDIDKIFIGTILTPYILIEDIDDITLCIIIDDIEKTRTKKIKKIMKKSCQL